MKELLEKTFKKYNILCDSNQIDEFQKYYDMMINYNQSHNLTSITDIPDVIIKHYLDSILPFQLIEDNTKIIDLGCGGGFPSIPLKIMNKSFDFTAVDSVTKKTDFVRSVANELRFNNFNVIHSRIEDLAFDSNYREQYDYIVSRAVAPLNIILEYSAPFAKDQGLIVCYKGSKYQEEINASNNALKKLNCEIVEIKEYYIEEIDQYRYILIVRKNGQLSTKYPRKQNKPRLQPL